MAKRKKSKPATVGFIPLGCPKNVVDSERMLAEIAQAGLIISADADNADIVIVNTCGFIAPARIEALEAIRHAVSCKAAGRVKKVIVAGCLAQRAGRQLFGEVKGLDAVVGLERRDEIADIIVKVLRADEQQIFMGQPPDRPTARGKIGPQVHDDRTRLLITPSHWAYLRISEGCDHMCSFCTIPEIRGRFRSKPMEMVLAEANELVSAGAVELIVIAQDTTSYGRDLKIRNGLAVLVSELENIIALKWIRLMYMCPSGINEQLIQTIAKSERIVHYFDIPIQHISDRILKAMRRRESKDSICRLIESLRSAVPDVVLRTTLIVGFPGETDEQFAELVEFVKWAKFDALGCFKYYPESGTAAAEMPDQIPEHVKNRRLEELMLTQQRIAFSKNEDKTGAKLSCLVDSVDPDGAGRGRYYGQAPDIDSFCLIRKCKSKPGRFIDIKVTGAQNYDLIAQQI